jgi:hypothetical protein
MVSKGQMRRSKTRCWSWQWVQLLREFGKKWLIPIKSFSQSGLLRACVILLLGMGGKCQLVQQSNWESPWKPRRKVSSNKCWSSCGEIFWIQLRLGGIQIVKGNCSKWTCLSQHLIFRSCRQGPFPFTFPHIWTLEKGDPMVVCCEQRTLDSR